MNDNTAYDITGEIDPVDKIDDVQAKLARRRQEREQVAAPEAKPGVSESESGAGHSPVGRKEEKKRSEAKKRAVEAARKNREEQERRRVQRQQELLDSRWITAGHKVREKRVEVLDRVFYRLKADGAYSGTKQEFFDEGLAMLEEKYSRDDTPATTGEWLIKTRDHT